MQISDVCWTDSDKLSIQATIDGTVVFVPLDLKNRHYAEIVRQGIPIAEPAG